MVNVGGWHPSLVHDLFVFGSLFLLFSFLSLHYKSAAARATEAESKGATLVVAPRDVERRGV